MPFTWESISSFFSSPAARPASPNGTPTLPFGEQASTKQKHLPRPLNPTFDAAVDPAPPSPAESSAPSAASDRDFLTPNSPYSDYQRSLSRTSTTTTVSTSAASVHHHQQHLKEPQHNERPHTAPGPTSSSSFSQYDEKYQPDIMSREFPKPAHEPTVEDMLARPPGKRSLQHYVKNCKERQVSDEKPQTEAEAAERARKFEEAKRELMADREKLASLVKKP